MFFYATTWSMYSNRNNKVSKGEVANIHEICVPHEIANDETFKALLDKVSDYINTYRSDASSSRPPSHYDQPDESPFTSKVSQRKKYHKVYEDEDVDETNKSKQNDDNACAASQEKNESSGSNTTKAKRQRIQGVME